MWTKHNYRVIIRGRWRISVEEGDIMTEVEREKKICDKRNNIGLMRPRTKEYR